MTLDSAADGILLKLLIRYFQYVCFRDTRGFFVLTIQQILPRKTIIPPIFRSYFGQVLLLLKKRKKKMDGLK